MAITYLESANLMQDADFNGRTRTACLHFADYISGEASTVPAHTSRLRWAQDTIKDAQRSVNEIMPILIMDPVIQGYGNTISDPDLQTATETAVNKVI